MTSTRRPTSALERHGADRALAQRVRFQAALLEAVGEAIIATDLSGAITFWNRAAENLYGWPADEVLGRNILEVTPSEEMRDSAAAVMERLLAGESWSGEFEVQRRDGTRFHAHVTDRPIYDDAGTLIGIVGVSRDVSEQKLAEKVLRDEARLVARLDSIGRVLTAELDLRRLARAVIHEATQLTGAEGGAFVYLAGQTDASFRAAFSGRWRGPLDDGRFAVPALFRATLEDAEAVRVGSVAREPALSEAAGALLGDVAPESYMALPVRSRDGAVLGGLFFGHSAQDAFSAKHERISQGVAGWAGLALDNARLYAQAQRAVRDRDEMLAVVSHDLRNPLSTVLGAVSLIEQLPGAGSAAEVRTKHLGSIRRAVTSMNRLIEDLLEVTRIEAGRLRLQPQRVDAEEVLREALRAFHGVAVERRLALVLDAGEVPPVHADRQRLVQALWNLIGNAVKFTPDEGVIRIGARAEAAYVRFFVEDTGAGIPERDLPRVFDRFWHGSDAGSGSTGIGLTIVKGVVEAHGGTVDVESTVGEGTRFSFTIPVERLEARPADPERA